KSLRWGQRSGMGPPGRGGGGSPGGGGGSGTGGTLGSGSGTGFGIGAIMAFLPAGIDKLMPRRRPRPVQGPDTAGGYSSSRHAASAADSRLQSPVPAGITETGAARRRPTSFRGSNS